MKSFVCTIIFFAIVSGTAYAQEEGSNNNDILQTRPSIQVEEAISAYLERGGLYYNETFAPMVRPRVCRRREFQILPETPHPRAGWVLRIEEGECVTSATYFVHNPRMHRIHIISEREVIELLQLIPSVSEPSAP